MKNKLKKTDKDKKINKVGLYRFFINLTSLQNKCLKSFLIIIIIHIY